MSAKTLFVFELFAGFLLVELVARLVDGGVISLHPPPASAYRASKTIACSERTADTLTVALVGSSSMQAAVDPDMLAKALGQRPSVKMLALAVPGSVMSDHYLVAKAVRADVVVIGLMLRDFPDRIIPPPNERSPAVGPVPALFPLDEAWKRSCPDQNVINRVRLWGLRMFRSFALRDVLRGPFIADTRVDRLAGEACMMPYDFYRKLVSQGWGSQYFHLPNRQSDFLDHLGRHFAAQASRCILLLLPENEQTAALFGEEAWLNMAGVLQAIEKDGALDIVDLRFGLSAQYFADAHHLNARGRAVLSQRLAQVLSPRTSAVSR